VLWTYLNLNQVHFQNPFAKGKVDVEFGEYRSGNKEVVLWTMLIRKNARCNPVNPEKALAL